MMADIFDTDLIVPESYESSCLGACVLGMKALGEIDDFSVIKDMVGTTHAHEPNKKQLPSTNNLLPFSLTLVVL